MAEVIEMFPVRYNGLLCGCGEAWFKLLRSDGTHGVVVLDLEGTVTGYSGEPVCVSCGATARPNEGADRG